MTIVSNRTDEHDIEVVSRVVGNAVVIHQAAAMSSRAREIALSVAADTEHDLVVVDLPPGASPAAWGQVADVLPRRRRGVRLILGGRSRETKALAAQLLAERIGRTVIAPDGVVRPGIDGALFVDSGPGTGWVRCRPGMSPQWVSKRFPRPAWDVPEVGRSVATSATGVAEPVLGGVWIRPAGADVAQLRNRECLQENLPCQHEVFTVVLGCPGAHPITFDDVARFWEHLPTEVRLRARFVEYGPITQSGDQPVGQVLADFFGERIVCYTGLPVASSYFPQVVTIRADGRWGWNSPARELAYTPRRGDKPPAAPELLSYRAPLDDVNETAPAVYWYAPDAVVEVIPAGLWVRGAKGAANAALIRARTLDVNHLLVVFDTSTEAVERRMRILAADLVAWLDETTRESAVLVASHDIIAAQSPVVGPALAGEVAADPPTSGVLAEPGPALPAPVPAAQAEVVPVPLPEPALPEPANSGPAVPPAVAQPVHGPSNGAPAAPAWLTTVVPAPDAPEVSTVGHPVPAPAGQPVPRTVAGTVPADPGTGHTSPVGPARPDTQPGEDAAAAVQQKTTPRAADGVPRFQPTPDAKVAAHIPARGVDEERAWLRKTLSRQYAAMANSVGRVLSEHPAFHDALAAQSGAVLTDAVAVRLYLSAEGDEVDQALRSGRGGAHVPFARCVVSGLRRLPSHRGPTVLRVTPTDAQWEKYRKRSLVTDWGFVNALAAPYDGQDGEVDVHIWSITGRRTKLLEPETEPTADRVLFTPGTNFKILSMGEPSGGGRGHIMLRELAAAEVGTDGRVTDRGLSFDEIALEVLRGAQETWAVAKSRNKLPVSAERRFRALPGLI